MNDTPRCRDCRHDYLNQQPVTIYSLCRHPDAAKDSFWKSGPCSGFDSAAPTCDPRPVDRPGARDRRVK